LTSVAISPNAQPHFADWGALGACTLQYGTLAKYEIDMLTDKNAWAVDSNGMFAMALYYKDNVPSWVSFDTPGALATQTATFSIARQATNGSMETWGSSDTTSPKDPYVAFAIHSCAACPLQRRTL
jgi:hypothetical protein